jgi:hypothetical protein
MGRCSTSADGPESEVHHSCQLDGAYQVHAEPLLELLVSGNTAANGSEKHHREDQKQNTAPAPGTNDPQPEKGRPA